ncbi:MAG: hypothetical protein GY730_02245 [bacterium]|nr:hypothetical protein [bacterium]
MMDKSQILSLEELKSFKKDIMKYKGVSSFSKMYPFKRQESIQNMLMETLVEKSDSIEDQLEIADIAFHISRFGWTEDICASGLDILCLIKESDTALEDYALQLRLFIMIKRLAEPAGFELSNLNRSAQKEVASFLDSALSKIREKTVIYYMDTRTNKYNNILNLSEEFRASSVFLKKIISNMVDVILTGPKTYSNSEPESSVITSEDILVKFLNQFANGRLGLEREGLSYDIKTSIINALKKLFLCKENITFNDEAEAEKKYFDHIEMTASKFFVKYISLQEKEIRSQISQDVDKADISSLSDHLNKIDVFYEIMSKIKAKKLHKAVEKNKEMLCLIKEEIKNIIYQL